MLVSGPSGQSVTVPDGSRRRVSIMKSTPCWSCSGIFGSGNSMPSSPVLPWTCSAVTSLRCNGCVASGEDRNINFASYLADNAGISGGVVQRHIARDGDDSQHLDILGAGQRQQDRDGIILSGIGVDDDLAGHGNS